MNFKYWEWEAAPYKEKLKAPSIKGITSALFTDETKAYRFACVLNTARQHPVQLKDCDTQIMPKSVWYYYLEMAVRLGMLDKQRRIYVLTNRFTRPFSNFAESSQQSPQGITRPNHRHPFKVFLLALRAFSLSRFVASAAVPCWSTRAIGLATCFA